MLKSEKGIRRFLKKEYWSEKPAEYRDNCIWRDGKMARKCWKNKKWKWCKEGKVKEFVLLANKKPAE